MHGKKTASSIWQKKILARLKKLQQRDRMFVQMEILTMLSSRTRLLQNQKKSSISVRSSVPRKKRIRSCRLQPKSFSSRVICYHSVCLRDSGACCRHRIRHARPPPPTPAAVAHFIKEEAAPLRLLLRRRRLILFLLLRPNRLAEAVFPVPDFWPFSGSPELLGKQRMWRT